MTSPVPDAAPDAALDIRALPDGPAWDDAYVVMRELRPHVDHATFLHRCREAARRDGYTLYGAFDGGRLVGVMGMRELVDLLHGRHLYVDDLVVAEAARSRGVGSRLLACAEAIARERGGLGLRLCTGIDHAAGRRFYEREGWAARAVAYKKGFAG